MTDDFNYEAPNVDYQDEIHARHESRCENVEVHEHTVTAAGRSVTFTVKTYSWKSFKYRHAKTGKPCDALEGLSDPDGIQSEETTEVEQEYRCADADVYGLPGFTDEPRHFSCSRLLKASDNEKVGTIADALADLLAEVHLDLVDPYPDGLRAHLDQELIKELNEDGIELAKKGLRQQILAVDFGNNDLKAVIITERKPYAANQYDRDMVEATLYEITAPGHRYRRCEKFAAGLGSRPHDAVMHLFANYAEEAARHHPTGVDARPANADLDLLCAQARRRWKQGIEDRFYVEAYVLDARGQLPSYLTTQEYDRLGYRPEMGQQVCVVRERWYTAPKLFRPSVDWNDAMALFDDLAHTMWGSAQLSLDGDCFNPPPWRMNHSGGFADLHHGVAVGETGQLAICRAFLHSNGEHPKLLRWDLNDDNVYDPFGDYVREKAKREAEFGRSENDWQEGGDAALNKIAELAPDHDASNDMRRGDPNGDLT